MRKWLASLIFMTQIFGLHIAHASPVYPNYYPSFGYGYGDGFGPVQPSTDFWYWLTSHRHKKAEPIDLCQHRVELIEDYKRGVEASIQTYDQYAARKAELQALAQEIETAKAACVND